MATIIVDLSQFKRRTGRVPPKKGFVQAEFSFSGKTLQTSGDTFAAAVNECKKFARAAGATTIVLENIRG
jgi:hypothetical protein